MNDYDATVLSYSASSTILRLRGHTGYVKAVALGEVDGKSDGTPEQRNNLRLIGKGVGIDWPDLDEDISVRTLPATS